ncbi:MAG TPA: nicotinate phosphoribosyltransferase [Caldilineaceae bacterium]|nr:nicotinate phosphoribosyltransferase [Caldilineaceae bacterium]
MQPTERIQMDGILFTDQYQLTMAQLYYRYGLHESEVLFDHFFRRYPDYDGHQAGYCIAAGLEWLVEWMLKTRFSPAEIDYLRSQTTSAGARLFAEDFLKWLAKNGDFSGISLRAIPEGRVVHAHEPLTVVQGPLAMAQILETPLLNHLNYPTLIASKASRIAESARGRAILEFGLRRGQERGANAGARAALIGGALFTSNVAVSQALGLPPKGTHAHSMVQLFMTLGEGELGAFRAYADVYPDDCLLLVDTVNTLESGVPNAIRVFEELRAKGHRPVGIRLDSGDLAYLSIQAARMLDGAGFSDTQIVLSGDLDELVIWQIITQIVAEAPRYGVDPDHLINRMVYGVGTRLITSWGEPALGGVYKLVAVRENGRWESAIKISDTPAKVPNPGVKRIWRIYDQRGFATADLLCLEDQDPTQAQSLMLRHPVDHAKYRVIQRSDITGLEELHVEVLRQGRLVCDLPPLEELRRRRNADVERLDAGIRRLVNPHIYHVSLTQELWDLKQRLIAEAHNRSVTSAT